ncbi:MAG: acetate kinase [Carboxydocellales bacterium]
MKILVINCGSSSLKYQLYESNSWTILAKGMVERIGLEGGVLTQQRAGEQKAQSSRLVDNHQEAIELVLQALTTGEQRIMTSLSEIQAIGHRVVHGGEQFAQSVLIDDRVMAALEECSNLAPLHNPPNIIGIKCCQQLLPGVPQVGVFDTAFHQTMPPQAYLYGLPYELYQKYGIRRYGFHGTSHQYVAQRAAVMLGKDLQQTKIITCHLGNGSSIAAIRGGISLATSMGFTPLSGLLMGTRSGDIDPVIVTFLMEREGLTIQQLNDLLNKKSGVLGLSGVASDFRDLEAAAKDGHQRAQLALEVFASDVKKYIGAYLALLNGADALVFTAGVGENSILIRSMICDHLEYLGIKLDEEQNQLRGQEVDISAAESKVKVLVIPTNEELMIAIDTESLVGGQL